MEERKTRFTLDRSMISSPILTGWRNWKLSTDAVTQGLRAWRRAAMAAQRSTRCMSLPPRTLPRPLASLGSASSEYSEIESRTGWPSIGLLSEILPPQVALDVSEGLPLENGFRGMVGKDAALERVFQRTVSERMMIALQDVVKLDAFVLVGGDGETDGVGPFGGRGKARTIAAGISEIAGHSFGRAWIGCAALAC